VKCAGTRVDDFGEKDLEGEKFTYVWAEVGREREGEVTNEEGTPR
jgi:hypothetical protein